MPQSPLFIRDAEILLTGVGKEKKWVLVCFRKQLNCQIFTHICVVGKVGKDCEAKDYKYKKTNDNKKIGVRPSRENKRKE
jgi:hypothetical protein